QQLTAIARRIERNRKVVGAFARPRDRQRVARKIRTNANTASARCGLNLFATVGNEVDLRRASRSDRHRVSATIDRDHLRRFETAEQRVVNALSLSLRKVSGRVIDSSAHVVSTARVELERAGQ